MINSATAVDILMCYVRRMKKTTPIRVYTQEKKPEMPTPPPPITVNEGCLFTTSLATLIVFAVTGIVVYRIFSN